MSIGQHVARAEAEQAQPKQPKTNAMDLVSIKVPRWVAQDIAVQVKSPMITPAPNNERIITLKGKHRQAIEALFQTTIESPEQLVDKVRRLCLVKINGVEYTFTADELARFEMQAKFHGRTTEIFMAEMMQNVVGRMLVQI